MLVHTKKPPIKTKQLAERHFGIKKRESDCIQISVSIPAEKSDYIMQYLENQGCVCTDEKQDLVDAKELFADRTPANMLIGARGKENITQVELSKLTGIPRRHISDMENGRRPIGKQNAMKLEKALNISYRLFL